MLRPRPTAPPVPFIRIAALSAGDKFVATMHVERSTLIDAPPEQVYRWVSDFSTWASWSPWLCAEPDAKVTVSDNPTSLGGLYQWAGQVIGSGEIEHKELSPSSRIVDELRFLKPFASTSKVTFQLEPVAEQSRLTWTMAGPWPWFLFWMKSQMEGFIGMDFDRGLAMLKDHIEQGAVASKINVEGKAEVGPLQMLGVRKSCAIKDVGASMERDLQEAGTKLMAAGLSATDSGISVYHKLDFRKSQFEYTTGYLQPQLPSTIPAGLSAWSIPRTAAFKVEHVGSYKHLGNAWSAGNALMRHRKLKPAKHHPFELYRVAGSDVPETELITEIYLPTK